MVSYSTGKITPNSFKFMSETIVYWAARLRESAFNRFKPYFNYFLKRGAVAACEKAVASIFADKKKYLLLLK